MSSKSKMVAAIVAIGAVAAAIVIVAVISGGDDNPPAASETANRAAGSTESESGDEGGSAEHPPADPEVLAAQDVTLQPDDSKFGEMLTDHNGRTLYVFEPDKTSESTCYGECEEVWPPVLVEDDPALADGLSKAAGTTERKDGKLQATYNGRPLYYMVGEKPGVVKCQAMELHGGFWYVVDPDGEAITKSS